ncbi:MAG: hypothetical protein ACOYL5_07345 [Phototrophicaceae bacterium]
MPILFDTRTAPPEQVRFRLAHHLLLGTVALIVIASVVGRTWDALYHVIIPFDGFFSPPHVFIYACSTLAAFVVMGMVFSGNIRPAFGQGLKVWILPFDVPGSLLLVGFGIVLLGFAGLVLDNLWHTNFGLDETNWSMPHAMIGWSIALLTWGFVAGRLSLAHDKPIRWYSVLLMGYLLMAVTAGSVMGPFFQHRSPAIVEAISHLPALSLQPEFQHSTRIYLAWNLTRTNPLLLIFAPLWLGAIWACLLRLDRRWWLMLLIVTLWFLADDNQNNAQFLATYNNFTLQPVDYSALPVFLPTVLLLLLRRFRLPDRCAWSISGVLFGLLIFAQLTQRTQNGEGLLLFATIPAVLAGKWLGEQLFARVSNPNSYRQILPLILSTPLIPLCTGLVDLYLRNVTP